MEHPDQWNTPINAALIESAGNFLALHEFIGRIGWKLNSHGIDRRSSAGGAGRKNPIPGPGRIAPGIADAGAGG